MNITEFFDRKMDAPLANQQWSWGAVTRDETSIVLRVWADQTYRDEADGKRYALLLQPAWKHEYKGRKGSAGYNERVRQLTDAVMKGQSVKMVIIHDINGGKDDLNRNIDTKLAAKISSYFEAGRVVIREDGAIVAELARKFQA